MSDSGRAWQPWDMQELTMPLERLSHARVDPAEHALLEQRQREFKKQHEIKELKQKAYEEAFALGLKEGHAQGHADGFQAGEQAGLIEAQRQYQAKADQALAPLESLVREFEASLTTADDGMIRSLTALCVEIGSRLAGRAIAANPEQLTDLIRTLLHEHFEASSKPRLWLNPQDIGLINDALQDAIHSAGWQIQPDASIARGGCRVTSKHGEIDATMRNRLTKLIDQLDLA